MHPRIGQWIFVTGAPRSGTTFVGTVLSTGLHVDYIHEPFNPDCGIRGIDQPYLYLEPDEARERALRPEIDRLLAYDAPLKTGFYPNDSRGRRIVKHIVGSRGPWHLRLARLNPFHRFAVVKDPVGCLLTEYLLLRYGMRPIVMVRHPLGFVASVTRLGWSPALAPLLVQPRLVERYFDAADVDVARRYREGSAVQRAAVLWRLLNRVLTVMARAHPEILLVTHETLNEQPLPTFQRLFAHAGLPFVATARRRIEHLTRAANASARPGRVQDFRRDSRAIAGQYRRILDAAEIREVSAICEPVARLHYANGAGGA